VSDQQEVRQLLAHLKQHREVIAEKRSHVKAASQRHTWARRARDVRRQLHPNK
jgi:hypothetical protein